MSAKVIKKVLDSADDVAEFIAGPRPDNPISGPYHDYTRWVCDSYANVPVWLTTAATVAGAPNVSLGMESVCGQYLGIGSPLALPPFEGGQCPVVYLVELFNDEDAGPPTASAFVTGPVGQAYRTGPNALGFYTWFVKGNPDVSFRTAFPEEEWAVDSVTRVDGLPDDCGNPAPVWRPSPDRPADPGPTPPGGGQPPVFDPDGNPTFNPGPIDTPFGPVDHPPIDPFDPGDDSEPEEPDPYPPLPPGSQGDGDEPQDTGPDGEVEGEAPEGKVLVGLKIGLLTIPPSARPYTNSVYRAPCYIYMGGDAGLDQDYAGSMLRNNQFVFAEKPNLTKWLVSANTGWNIRVTPYYRDVEE